jgi:hypothetical protein
VKAGGKQNKKGSCKKYNEREERRKGRTENVRGWILCYIIFILVGLFFKIICHKNVLFAVALDLPETAECLSGGY